MLSESLNLEVWDRLIVGKPLDGLGFEIRDGLVCVHGLELPDPTVLRRFQVCGVSITEVDSGIIHGLKLRNIDFSRSKFAGLRLMRGVVENCCFDDCNLRGTRIWATSFYNVTFRGAKLHGSMLGGVVDGLRNRFTQVDFSNANLSDTSYEAAGFEQCIFNNAKLAKIDFQSSTFRDCRFACELNDVLFYRHGFEGEKYPPNEMIDVDFSGAKLHDVGFRDLVLDRVRFPDDDEHVVVRNFVAAMDQATETLNRQGDAIANKVTEFIRIHRDWAPPNQAQGVFNLRDLADVVGAEGVKRFLAAIPLWAKK